MQILFQERKEAEKLRKLGWSYSEIQQKVKVSQCSLSYWLRNISLSEQQIQRLKEKQRASQSIAVKAVRTRRIEKTAEIKQKARDEIGFLTDRERWLLGIALYWAEGSKEHAKGHRVCFCNSDPFMVFFFRQWAIDFFGIGFSDFVYELYIHEKAKNLQGAIFTWSSLLNINPNDICLRFKRHNISPKRKNIDYNYIGLLRINIRRSVNLNRVIAGWIDGIASSSSISIGE